MSNWDDDDYVPTLPSSSGPSLTTLPTKDNWDDDDNDEDAYLKAQALKTASTSTTATPTPAVPLKIKAKHVDKAKAKERSKDDSASNLCSNCQAELLPLNDPIAEKKRLENLMIKSDIAAAQALMGNVSLNNGSSSSTSTPNTPGSLLSSDTTTLVAAVSLLTPDSFKDFGKIVAKRVTEATGTKSSSSAARFYNEILQVGGDKLSVDELAALSKVCDTIRNRKLTEQRAATKKGSTKKATVAKLHVGADTEAYDDEGDYDDYAPTTTTSTGNSGNVEMSASIAGLSSNNTSVTNGGGGNEDKFTRSRFAAEDDFM